MDFAQSSPAPDPALVTREEETLWRFSSLSAEDVIFRLICSLMMWIMSCMIGVLRNDLPAAFSLLLDGTTCPTGRLCLVPSSLLTLFEGSGGKSLVVLIASVEAK